MSVVNIDNSPIFQSAYTYLQTAGSDGTDQTASGIHLKWDFLRKLGDTHLPKGRYADSDPYETTIGFNKSMDYIKIYRYKYSSTPYHLALDTSVEPDDVLLVEGKWNWIYSLQVNSFGRDKFRKVRFVFTNTSNYDTIAAGLPISNWQGFLGAYESVVELHVDSDTDPETGLPFPGMEDRLAFYYEFTASQPKSQVPFLLRIEAVGLPDSLEENEKQLNFRKKYTSATGTKQFYSENTEFVRFDSSGALITNIKLITYSDFIAGVNHENSGAGGWEEIYAHGQEDGFALTLDDNEMEARFLTDYIDGIHGRWPKFNDADSSTGEFVVGFHNYFERWRRSGYTFSSTSPDGNDPISLQNFIHDYMLRSTTDVKAMVSLPSDEENDPSVQTISYLDMLKLVSLDYHVSRMLGLGHIDLDTAVYDYVYCLEYVTNATLDGPYNSAASRTHTYMSLPTSKTTYRLPKAPVLKECTFGAEIANGTDTPSAITDAQGYTPQEPLRFININREKYNHEYVFEPFFARTAEIDLSLETQPIAYGLEYKEINETAYRKPEISHDQDYSDPAGIPETVPIMENGTERMYTHQEDENGTHQYAAYAINWFSRVSPLSNTKQVTTQFPVLNRLLPPFNYAVQLIQDEDPSEAAIPDKTLMLTTATEQGLLAEFTEDEDQTLVRTTFDWNHVHAHAHPTVDYAEFFFREDEPSVVRGKITGVTLIDSDTALIQTGSYQITSNFPVQVVQPTISSTDTDKYIGSFFSSGSSHYMIESFPVSGSTPTIKVKVLKQNQAIAPDPVNQNQFLSQETIQLPQVGDLFFIIENMGEPANWDLKHNEQVYIEKFYFNESITLRYSPTLTVQYPVGSVTYTGGNTNFNLSVQLKSAQTTGVKVEFAVRPRITEITPNSVTVFGDWTSVTATNTTFRLFGSEFNEGVYTILSSSYSSSSLSTTINIQGFFPNGQLTDGVIHMIASFPVTGLSTNSNRVSISEDKTTMFNLANIEYVTESDDTQTRFVVGGKTLTVTFHPLLDTHGNGTGYIQAIANQRFPAHPDSRVEWYKGTVRLTDLTGKKQVYPVSYIGNLSGIYTSSFSFVIQDPGFIPINEADPDPADSYTFDLNASQSVNFHPSYRVYLETANGLHPVTGAAIPGGGIHFNETATTVVDTNPLVISRQTLMAVRSVDFINGLRSYLSSPVVLFAQKIAIPKAPDRPIGPVYATRPNYYGKSSYTFDTKIDTTGGRSPYSMVFYRASDDAILEILYTSERVLQIKSDLSSRPQSFVNDQQLWDILINAIPESGADNSPFKTLTTTDGSYTWPLPNNPDFYVDFETRLPIDENNYPAAGLSRPFKDLDEEVVGLNYLKDVYGTDIKFSELIKMAVQNAFTPLNEQPPLYGHFRSTTRQTSPGASIIRDTNGNLLDPLTNDIYPMIRRFTDNGNTIVRFTDYSLDGASVNKYFYRAMELDDKFKFSPPSGTLGPVILVNSLAPDQPQVRKVLTRLPDPSSNISSAVTFELNPYISKLNISKFEIYRAIGEDAAMSVRTMQKVKIVSADAQILDDFENDPFPLYGENLYYRLVAIREITDVADVMQSDETISIDAPSRPSDPILTTIVDSINPEAPDLSFVFGNVTSTAFEDVEVLWEATCYNGTYALQKMNSSGNWNEIYKVKQATGAMIFTLEDDLPRVDEDGNALYHRFRVVVENSSGLFNLVQKEFIVSESQLVQEDNGSIDLEDNSGSIII